MGKGEHIFEYQDKPNIMEKQPDDLSVINIVMLEKHAAPVFNKFGQPLILYPC